MKVLIIGGMPGTGKTTLMKKWMDMYEFTKTPPQKNSPINLVEYSYAEKNGTRMYLLGRYDEGEVFGGTDRLSMAVQPQAIKFLDACDNHDFDKRPAVVVMEGDRLFTPSFLEHCTEEYNTRIMVLTAEKELLKTRYAERGSDQNETWLKGRESKINGVLTNMMLMDNTEVYPHENESHTNLIIQRMEDFIWRE